MGNRTAGSHGNFLSVRMTGVHESKPEGMISVEVDEDGNGKNYIGVESSKTGLNDGKWHHVAVVRNNNCLNLYIDGILSGSGTSNGIANISNGNEFKIGRSLDKDVADRFAPNALYEDLRIYNDELYDTEIDFIFKTSPILPKNIN